MARATKQARDERVDLRLSGELKRVLEQAASLEGQTVSSFILGAAIPHARKVLRDAAVLELSDRDSRRFLDALDDDSAEPNEAMLRAVKRYKQSSGRRA
jgi:uncharacterized protein (DUF1778 family)